MLGTRHSIPPKAQTGRRLLKVPRVQNWLPTRGISAHYLTIEECNAKVLCPPFSLAVAQDKCCTTPQHQCNDTGFASFLILIRHHFLSIALSIILPL